MHIVKNFAELNLESQSTLQDLPFWEISIEIDSPGENLTRLFQEETLIPGIILTKDNNYAGMISRRQYFEFMSRRYSLGLFSARPIKNLYNLLQPEILVVSDDRLITEATQMALERSPQLVYEPIVIKTKSEKHGILDLQQLLLAQSQIHFLTLAQLQQTQEKFQIAETALENLQHNYTQLAQAEKMAIFGQYVTDVINEINTPVNWIGGQFIHLNRYIQDLIEIIHLYEKHYPVPVVAIQTAIKKIELSSLPINLSNLLNSLKERTKNIQQIIRSFRNISNLEDSEKKTVDIHEIIDMTLILLQNRLKTNPNNEGITVVKNYNKLPLVECYPGQLNQVFLNILSNAIEVLDKSDITEKTIENPQISLRTEILDDDKVQISITDNGMGISQSLQKKIFDPFFTTKSAEKSTGMGLAISHQIITEKHRGKLDCNSTPGEGTEFIITIPVSQPKIAQI